jgi:protein-S-isoprenylcysteine O-methyltransferase Ste14
MHEFRIFCTRLCSAAANTAFTSAAVRAKSGGMEALLKLNIATLALIAIILPIFAGQFWGPPWTVARVAGLAVAISSFLLLALARIQLGQAFSVQAKATTLVTSGIYSRIRNPIYIFGGLTIAGFFLWINRPRLLLCFAVLIPMQVYRIRKEERVLTEKFGVSYLDYKRQTWF